MHDDLLQSLALSGVVELEAFGSGRAGEDHHDPRSAYVERYWLPLLGPSTLLLIRQLASRLDEGETSVDLVEVSRALGLGYTAARGGAFVRTLRRAVSFDMVRLPRPRAVGLRRAIPSLRPRQLERLPEALRSRHGPGVAPRGAAASDRTPLGAGSARQET